MDEGLLDWRPQGMFVRILLAETPGGVPCWDFGLADIHPPFFIGTLRGLKGEDLYDLYT